MSDHLELGVQRARALHGLQDGEQVLRRRAERVQGLDHVGQLGAGGQLDQRPGSCLMVMSAFSRHRLAAGQRPGWLMTGVELMVTDRLPCATAQATA
jgi:hypothetical protein